MPPSLRQALLDAWRRRRAAPLDWRRGRRDPTPDPPPGPADVVIPVAGAAAELEECIASLLATTDLTRHRLQLVLDGPAAPATELLVAELSRRDDVALQVLRHPRRRGFVASVNHALERSQGDVVLLNSDTVLTEGWLEKLQAAAYSSPAIATATPFSNHATLCSLPRMGEENALPAGWTVERFAALVERVSERRYPRIPTGVGVCLYVKRRALDELGHFDEASFGLGYGEESEFCTRALRAGWLHVLDDATFIYHAGQRSFGRSRRRRVAAAHRKMRRLHPEYLPTIASFLDQDPLAPVRRRVLSALAEEEERGTEPSGDPIVHVVHGWPPYNHAGTEEYARWLALWQRAHRPVAVYARIADPFRDSGQAVELLDHGVRVRLVVNNFDQRDPLARNAIRNRRLDRDFARFLDQLRPALAHVHHLSGHSMSLVRVLRRRRVPYVFQVQDWWSLCARANLVDRRGRLCSGPGLGKCSDCLPLTTVPPGGSWSRALHALRRRAARRVWKQAAALVMGSRFIADSFREAGWPRAAAGRVVPYGVPLADLPPAAATPATSARRPRRIGYIGSIMPHKGVHVLAEALRDLDPGEVVVELWGDPSADPAYTARLAELAGSTRLDLRGRFPDARKAEVLRSLDVLVVPSIGLESFGLVAREAMACGTPVVATTAGALRELRGAVVVPPGDAAALRRVLLGLLRQPDALAELRRRVPPTKGLAAHAEEIEEIYREIGAGAAGA